MSLILCAADPSVRSRSQREPTRAGRRRPLRERERQENRRGHSGPCRHRLDRRRRRRRPRRVRRAPDPCDLPSLDLLLARPGGRTPRLVVITTSGLARATPLAPGLAARGWRRGTRTEALRSSAGRISGYLNATRARGSRARATGAEFRLEHNRDEGERDVTLLAAAPDLRFRAATGSCVLDSYMTESGNRYRELACIVSGASATTVIVGAAPPGRWAAEAPTIEQAIDSFTT